MHIVPWRYRKPAATWFVFVHPHVPFERVRKFILKHIKPTPCTCTILFDMFDSKPKGYNDENMLSVTDTMGYSLQI